jgi:hypothetical protein
MFTKCYSRHFMFQIVRIFSLCVFSQTTLAQDNFNYISITDEAKLEKAYAVEKGNSIDPISDGINQNALYQQIYDELNLEYEHIGKREAQRVLANNRLTVTGGLNSIGFSYRRPFIDFGVTVDRNLAPDLFDDKRWIVTDTFTVSIDASKILGNLKGQGAIDMTQENLAAFAGVVFNRSFTWVHYASSYEDGLMGHFEKLFMPFSALSFSNIQNMAPNEMIFKEDSISLKAGGLVSAPLYSGITGSAGVLAKFEKISKVEVVSTPSTNGSPTKVNINFEKTKVVSAGASFRIQADFLKILKMTLLSYDFNYQLDSSYKIYLNINQNELGEMSLQHPVAMELQQILKNREGDLDTLAPYLISEEKRKSQTIAHKYNFLLLGGQRASKTQQIEITKAGKVKTFFRHYFEKVKYTEDMLSRLFASFVYAIMDVDISANKMASDSKKVSIEYDSERNLLEAHEDIYTGSNGLEQKLSMTFTNDYYTKKTSGTFGKKYRDRAKFILERMSGVNPLAISMIENDQLKAPYQVSGKYQVNIDGIRYFNSLQIGTAFDYMDGLCDEKPRKSFLNFRNLFDNCRRSLQNDYIEYLKDLSHNRITSNDIDSCEKKSWKYIFSPSKKRAFIKNCLAEVSAKAPADRNTIPLWPLKNFATNVANNCNSKVHYFNLFGVPNVFFFGTFTAKTENGADFETNFHEGAFKGLGAVDHYMRVENLRAPSSIVVDQ